MALKVLPPPTAGKLVERQRPPQQGRWTYDDYTHLPDNGMRYEVIKGELYMAPAPSPEHQKSVSTLHGSLWQYNRQKIQGELLTSPIDVILPGRATPVQPDLLFISKERRDIIKEKHIEGAPDLIAEVLSPGNPNHDRRTKFHLYAEAGVQEYWIVDPISCIIDVYVLRGQAYALLGAFTADDTAYSELLPGFTLPVKEICGAKNN